MEITTQISSYLARHYAKLYSREMFVGITGSLGKSSCVAACKAVLSAKYKTLATESDLDPVLSIPRTLLKINPSVKKIVLKMGMQYRGEMDFYLSQIKPKVAIVTKIYAHNATLGDINGIMEETGKLVESVGEDGVAILNFDDTNCRKLAEKCPGTVLYYGMDPKNCNVWAGNIQIENYATSFELNSGVERVKVNLKLLGLHQVYPALAAAVLGIVCNIPLTKIKLALESIEPEDHHLQTFLGPNGSVVLDDTYNSSPVVLESAIDALLQIPARRRVVVLGEMRDLGEYSESMNRRIAQKIYKEKLDFVFLGQGDTKYIAEELKSLGFWEERLEYNLQNSQLVSKLLKTLGKGDVCLIKGSKSVRLDEVVKRVAKKS